MTKRIQFQIQTASHQDLIAITDHVQSQLKTLDIKEGLINLFILHTTCGLTVNENADPDVVYDLLHRLNSLAPWDHPKDRHGEGNSAAHLKSSILGPSLTLPIQNGELVLGTWQGIFLGEFDGPRIRTIHMTAITSS